MESVAPTNRLLIVMTFGQNEYAKIPLNNLARPFGTVSRSRYLKDFCTEEACNLISDGYTGETYYFLRIKETDNNNQAYLLPLRKIKIIKSKAQGNRLYVDYNLLDYCYIKDQKNPSIIYNALKEEINKEPAKLKNLVVFCADKNKIENLVSCGKDTESWLKSTGPIRSIIPGTKTMSADSKKPLLVCTTIMDSKNKPVLSYEDKGIQLNSGETYKISLCLDMLDNQAYSKVSIKLKSDKDSIKGVTNKSEFFTSYDEAELYLCVTRKLVKFLDDPITTFLDISLISEDPNILAPDVDSGIMIVPKLSRPSSWQIIVFAGVVIASTITYWDKLASNPISIYSLYLLGTIAGSTITTFALGKISS